MSAQEKLLAIADELQVGPSGTRQVAIANELRVLAAETVPAPKESPTAGSPRVPARSKK